MKHDWLVWLIYKHTCFIEFIKLRLPLSYLSYLGTALHLCYNCV